MENKLPRTWTVTTLGEVAMWASGGTPTASNPKYYGGGIPWLIIGDLNDGYIDGSKKFITELGLKNSSVKMVPKGSVLVAMYGSIGKLGIANIECTTNQAIAFTKKIYGNIFNKYLFYYLYSQKRRLLEIGKGGNQANISQTLLKEYPLILAPIQEQQRIAKRLDVIFGKVHNCKKILDSIYRTINGFRQSVLRSAVNGELISKSFQNLPLQKIGDIGDISGGITLNSKRGFLQLQYPYLRVANVYANEFRLQDVKTVGVASSEIDRTLLQFGDLLVVEGNGSLDQIGRVAMWKDEIENCLHQNHLIKIRFDSLVTAEYILYYLLSPLGRQSIEEVSTSTSGLNNLSISKIHNIQVRLPDKEDQELTIKKVHDLFRYADQIEAHYDKAKAWFDKIPQAILAKAFRGELVPQDEHDEPASELLKRIKAEKEMTAKTPVRKKKLKPAKPNKKRA